MLKNYGKIFAIVYIIIVKTLEWSKGPSYSTSDYHLLKEKCL